MISGCDTALVVDRVVPEMRDEDLYQSERGTME
jgi:hypothetical protein